MASSRDNEQVMPSSADQFSIQRMLHFDDLGRDERAAPQRLTPAKRVAAEASSVPPAPARPPFAPRHPASSSMMDDSRTTLSQPDQCTPRRSSRGRTDVASPALENARVVATSTPTRRSPRQPSPSRGNMAALAPTRRSPRQPSPSRRNTATPAVTQQSSVSQPDVQRRMGRPLSDIWVHFTKSRDKKSAKCNYCPTVLNNPKPGSNMSTHLMRGCKEIDPDVREAFLRSTTAMTPEVPLTTTVEAHTQRTDPVLCPIDQATFNMLLVQLVVICALPFSILESMAFKEFVRKLAPGIKVPPRQYLTTELLQSAAESMRADVIARINKQKYVSIVTDGWSDPNGAKIVNFLVVAPGMPSFFWSSWASGAEAHTSDNLEQKVREVIEQVEELTTARVVGIVTDNASNMRGLWSRLKRLAIVAGGCAAHVLNLLMKNLFAHDVLKKVQSNCVQLSKFVRDHTGLLDTFRGQLGEIRSRGGKRRGLTLPVPTRWYSVFNCLENVLANRDELYELFTSPEYASLRNRYAQTDASRAKLKYVTAIVEDMTFWENLRVVVRLIKPIKTALGKIEADNEFASGVYSCFRSLLHHEVYRDRTSDNESLVGEAAESSRGDDGDRDDLPDPAYSSGYQRSEPIVSGVLEKFFREKIQQRWTYVHTNAMGIAFFLDPRCKFSDFESQDEAKTRNAIVQFALEKGIIKSEERSDLNREIFGFAAVKAEESAMEKTTPTMYWKSMERSYPLLGKIANIVFALPTSSAASERAWSIFNHIHTKKRNRLSVDKVELLVYIYINYAAIKNEKVDIARHVSQPESFDNAS